MFVRHVFGIVEVGIYENDSKLVKCDSDEMLAIAKQYIEQ